MKLSLLFPFIALVFAGLPFVRGEEKPASLNPLEMQKARAKSVTSKGQKAWYTEKFDLSDLPNYQPKGTVSGIIRQWGNNYIADSNLAKWWEEAFQKFHPDVKFADNLTTSVVGIPGLVAGVADIGMMGREVLWDEIQAYQRQFSAQPLEITICTGSFNVPGWTFALGIFVNENNPLTQLNFEQLDGIFGAQRTGGWKGQEWDPTVARGPEKNIRTWGQLGLTGEWADKPIHVYGYTPQFHFPDEFSKKVLGGSTKFNETLKEYVNHARPDGTLALAGDIFMEEMAKDPYSIAFTGIPHWKKGTKALAVSQRTGGPFVELNLKNVQNRSYPLVRDVYAYVHSGEKMGPAVNEFLRFILSREGQEFVMKDGKYLPLTAEECRTQLKKIE